MHSIKKQKSNVIEYRNLTQNGNDHLDHVTPLIPL